jgi:TolB-like protein
VISRQTSDLYRNRLVDIAAVGSQLAARYVVVGSVHSEAARLRINVELVDAATRVQEWTTRIERNKSELPAAADEIAWGITRQLHVGVTMAEERRPKSGAPHLIPPVIPSSENSWQRAGQSFSVIM